MGVRVGKPVKEKIGKRVHDGNTFWGKVILNKFKYTNYKIIML
jgi:hypothetical protein